MPAATALKPATDTAVTSTTASLADAALTYAGMGLAVFPLAPRSKSPLKGSHGFKDAATDLATVERWWQEHPDANIGLATGLPSGVIVLDVDPRNGGNDTLADLEAQHGRLPSTIESITGSGGRHVLFVRPDANMRTGTHALGAGLDIKSDGGYIVLPPSVHPNGQRYEWEVSSAPGGVDVAPMPEWMVEALSQPTTYQVQPTPNRNTTIGVGGYPVGYDGDTSGARLGPGPPVGHRPARWCKIPMLAAHRTGAFGVAVLGRGRRSSLPLHASRRVYDDYSRAAGIRAGGKGRASQGGAAPSQPAAPAARRWRGRASGADAHASAR